MIKNTNIVSISRQLFFGACVKNAQSAWFGRVCDAPRRDSRLNEKLQARVKNARNRLGLGASATRPEEILV